MLVKKKSRIKYENSPKCIAYEYPMNDRDINIAFIKIKGRYPDKGQVTNEVVKELIFVVKGKGKIVIDKKEHNLEEGDSVIILPKQKYSFNGMLELIVSCSPAWYPEQHKHIDTFKSRKKSKYLY